MDELALREAVTADIIAERYRQDGYEVSRQSPLEFAPSVRADLLVRKGEEVKVIEIKSRSSLAASRQTSEIARLVRSQPGWSFELVLIGEAELGTPLSDAHPLESEGVLERLRSAEKALDDGNAEAAFLLAWSAYEAALRVLVVEEGLPASDATVPDHVLDYAVFNGIVSRDDYERFREFRKLRNALAHGFQVDTFDPEAVAELIRTVRRILSGTESTDD